MERVVLFRRGRRSDGRSRPPDGQHLAGGWRSAATVLTSFWGALVLLVVWLAQPAYLAFGPSTEVETTGGEIAALSRQFDCWGNDGKPHPFPDGVLIKRQDGISHDGSDLEVNRLLHHLNDPHLVAFCRL